MSALLRQRLAAVIAAAGTILLLAAPPPAQSAVPRGFWGMNATNTVGRSDTPAQFQAMKAMGVSWVRYAAFWEQVEPFAPVDGKHAYRWTAFDTSVRQATDAGLQVRSMVGYSPTWASADGTKFGAPKDPQSYASFVRALLRRWGPYGDMWQSSDCVQEACRVRGANPIEHIEVWNEPNFSFFWHQPDPAKYGAMLRATIDAVRSEPRLAGVKIGVGGLLAGSATPSKIEQGDFLRRMVLAEPTLATTLGEINMHAYHKDTTGVMAQVAATRTGADSAGLHGVPVVINENGWTTSAVTGFHLAPVTEDVRAAKFYNLMGRVNYQRTTLKLTGYSPFTWLTPELDPANGEHWFGIANHDATLKPSAVALRDAWTLLGYEEPLPEPAPEPAPEPVTTTPESPEEPLKGPKGNGPRSKP